MDYETAKQNGRATRMHHVQVPPVLCRHSLLNTFTDQNLSLKAQCVTSEGIYWHEMKKKNTYACFYLDKITTNK